MKGARWVVVAAVLVVVLVLPSVGQGKSASVPLVWLQGSTRFTSYNFGAVKPGSSWSTQFTLKNLGRTASGKLAVRLAGSTAFSIIANGCKGKNLRPKKSCSITVRYAPSGALRTGDSAALKARLKPPSLNLHGIPFGPFGHLYWVNPGTGSGPDGTVNEVPLGGSGSATTIASFQTRPSSVAVNSTHVYWVNENGGTVKEVLIGSGQLESTLVAGQNGPIAVALDSTHVYWVNHDGGAGNDTVNAVPLGGGNVITVAGGQSEPCSVAVATHVYWSSCYDGTVKDVPVPGGSVNTDAGGQQTPLSVAVDDTHIYWVDYDGGTVNEVPLGGGDVTPLATGQTYPRALAVDDKYVYWVNLGNPGSSNGSVNRVPLAGGPVTKLATDQPFGPVSIAVDSTHVYWVSFDGTVNEIPLGGGQVTTLASGQSYPISVAVGP